jgi:hypothetical protein
MCYLSWLVLKHAREIELGIVWRDLFQDVLGRGTWEWYSVAREEKRKAVNGSGEIMHAEEISRGIQVDGQLRRR